MNLKDIFTSAVRILKETFDPERNTLLSITNGCDVDPDILDAMRDKKGWDIQVHEEYMIGAYYPSIPVFVTDFSAVKNDQKVGSPLWYRDLCDVTGIPYEKAPGKTTNNPEPPQP